MKLKKCPFCKGKVKLFSFDFETNEEIERTFSSKEELEQIDMFSFIHCKKCKIDFTNSEFTTIKKLIKSWNKRR